MDIREVDVIVIGAGAVGENVADRTVKGGLETVIVESELVGGECSYWACMPSKALLRSGAAVRAAHHVDGAKQAVTGSVDVTGTLRRRDAFASNWNDSGQVEWLGSADIDLVRGHGRLTAPREVTVTGADGVETVLRARHAVVISTGSSALVPGPLEEVEPWTSREVTSAQEIPASLAIIGGGVVGCEMATAYAGFGAKVTVISRGPLLEQMEPFASDLVQQSLEAMGVTVKIKTDVVSAHRTAKNAVVELAGGGKVVAEQVLVAVGRTPRTEDVGLDRVGLEPGSWIRVDDTLQAQGVDWLYAVGDVNGRALLTHQGKYQARAAGDAIAARARGTEVDTSRFGAHVATADQQIVPQVTFTDPEVASVGLTEKAALAAGIRVKVLDQDLGGVAGAATVSDHYVGHARAIVDADREVLVGATFVGPDVAELLHSATVAIVGEVPISRLWHAVPSYPTVSEVWLRWLEAYGR
ncbi:MAG: NAD(P)/FAD-dependent oxidoreductase, partial [Aeromicrobium sp.]